MKLGLSVYFSAAHSLLRHLGKCRNLHGHTYKLEVIVEGEKNPDTEFIVDFLELKAVVKEVLELVNHSYLNELIEYPTSENIALFLKRELERKLRDSKPGISLHSLKNLGR